MFVLDTEFSPVQDLVRAVREALEAGAAGVIAGNSVFHVVNPARTVEILMNTIHGKKART